MRISVSEWSALTLALKLPRSLLNPELWAPAVSKHLFTRRGIAGIALALIALLVVLHVKATDPAVARLSELAAHLASVRLIDARWDLAVAHARLAGTTAAPAVQSADVSRIERALDAAAAESKTAALDASIAELRKRYVEKADLVSRFERASSDSRQALLAAMRADAAVTASIRDAWRDFPQRERLVAAENLAVRVIAEAQQYHYFPSATHRASLAAYNADLPRAQSLPKPVHAALQRLETDIHQILLLKPLEQMLSERLAALKTSHRIDELSELFRAELTSALARSDRYRIALIVYTVTLALLLIYCGARAIARYRDLELLYAAQTRELAKTLRGLPPQDRGARVTELRRPDAIPNDEEARIISEHRVPFGSR